MEATGLRWTAPLAPLTGVEEVYGVIAAGSDATAVAGAEILERGGNAVDAAVAACLATGAGEPTLTSLGGGGALIYRSAESGEVTICDFFADAPGLGGCLPDELEFPAIEVDFGPATQQFFIGAGSAAVPGVIPGLFSALERWGSLDPREVVAPAARMLRQGIELGPWQAYAVWLLKSILVFRDETRRQYSLGERLLEAGDRFVCPALADTFEALGRDWRRHYEDVIGAAMIEQFGPAAGGLITAEDLAHYEVRFREPLQLRYRGAEVYTNPLPAAGGEMIALMLDLLQQRDLGKLPVGSAEQLRALCQAMRVADEARSEGRGAFVLGQRSRWIGRYEQVAERQLDEAPLESGGSGSTTHVSVIDAAGNGAAVTFSYGEGNGYLIGDSGIVMNNLMGEEGLFPDGFHSWPPGERISTMMSPTVVVSPSGDLDMLGTGGSNRIRTALTQVICYLHDYRLSVERAIQAPRVHFEAGVLNGETFDWPEGPELDRLGARDVVRFDEPNLFFGGVHLARRRADGTLEGAGDPRRGGAFRVV